MCVKNLYLQWKPIVRDWRIIKGKKGKPTYVCIYVYKPNGKKWEKYNGKKNNKHLSETMAYKHAMNTTNSMIKDWSRELENEMNQLLLICYTQTVTIGTNLISFVLSTLFVFLTCADKHSVAIVSIYIICILPF